MKKDNKLIVISIIILLIIWQCISIGVKNELLFPSIQAVFKKLYGIVSDVNLIKSILYSIYRCVLSTLIALLISILLGIGSYINKYIYNFCYPIFSVMRSLPTMAFIVLALIWFSKDYAPILIGVLIAGPIFYDVTLSTLNNIDDNILDMCNIYGVRKHRVLINIYLSSILFSLIDVISSSISLVFKVVIAGELYSQPIYGIGAAIQFEKIQLNTDSIIAWICIVTVVSIAFDKIVHFVTNNMFSWKRSNMDDI